MRLDAFLVTKGLCRSRATAGEAIKSGHVQINGKTAVKPAAQVTEQDEVTVTETKEKYVSRGGYKLEGALNAFSLDVTGLICVDIGASTGGFTDCLLQRGAASVLAIDAGTGQLVPTLAADPRVTSLENTNIRDYSPETPHFADFVCVDVSFISLRLVLPAVALLLKDRGTAVCLIKPQFEAGRSSLNKKGIVRDERVHKRVIDDVTVWAETLGLTVDQVIVSPIRGGDGNTEFLARMIKKSS